MTLLLQLQRSGSRRWQSGKRSPFAARDRVTAAWPDAERDLLELHEPGFRAAAERRRVDKRGGSRHWGQKKWKTSMSKPAPGV